MRIQHQDRQGFTIIEVVLVLAIAAMILAMVFFALPGLQKSRRDTARRRDLTRMLSLLEHYAANNGGSYPATQAATDSFVTGYMTTNGETWADPSTAATYAPTYTTTIPASPSAGAIYYSVARTCSSGTFSAATGNNRDVAAVIILEKSQYCLANR